MALVCHDLFYDSANRLGGRQLLLVEKIPAWLRAAETVGMAAFFGCLQWVTLELLVEFSPGPERWPGKEWQMIFTTTLVGACIGFFVPHFYRRSFKEPELAPVPPSPCSRRQCEQSAGDPDSGSDSGGGRKFEPRDPAPPPLNGKVKEPPKPLSPPVPVVRQLLRPGAQPVLKPPPEPKPKPPVLG